MQPKAKRTLMTRMHFEAIAATLKAARIEGRGINSASDKYVHEQWVTVVEAFARQGPTWNEHFNAARFLAACGKDS